MCGKEKTVPFGIIMGVITSNQTQCSAAGDQTQVTLAGFVQNRLPFAAISHVAADNHTVQCGLLRHNIQRPVTFLSHMTADMCVRRYRLGTQLVLAFAVMFKER